MRARKLAAVAPEDPPPSDAWAADEEPALDRAEDAGPIACLCVVCGTEGCRVHGEVARLDAPSRAVHDAADRLRRAAAEHRAAERTLRKLVLSEVARGMGDIETAPAPRVEPCPRCSIRDAEEASATTGAKGATGATKATPRRAKGENGQQSLPFKAS
jgi:hypothetical protein